MSITSSREAFKILHLFLLSIFSYGGQMENFCWIILFFCTGRLIISKIFGIFQFLRGIPPVDCQNGMYIGLQIVLKQTFCRDKVKDTFC